MLSWQRQEKVLPFLEITSNIFKAHSPSFIRQNTNIIKYTPLGPLEEEIHYP
jgi:hypothetical protein